MVFTRWPREDSFPFSLALGGKCRRLSRFCNNILLQDLTPLHVKIKRSTNLWSVCRRKLKLSTYRIYLINRPGCLLNFWTLRVGAYSRWALIRGWALIQINTVIKHSKLQPHKQSEYTLGTLLSSCHFRILLSIR